MDIVEINQICNRGQNFRSALALAALTGKSVHFTGFCSSKCRKTGLMRQHLAWVRFELEKSDEGSYIIKIEK